jgi:ferredoxin/nitrate reductase gamma subunit
VIAPPAVHGWTLAAQSSAAGLATAQGAVPTREVQWNVTPAMVWFMYASMVIALGVCAYGIWRRARVWRLGRPAARWDRPWTRARRVLVDAVAHRSLLRDPLPGVMHALLFFGFVVLFAATAVVMIHHDLGVPIMQGRFYLYFQSLTVNAFGLLAMVGTGIAAWRRWVAKSPRLEQGKRGDVVLLAALFFLLATGFLISGLRIAATTDPWAPWRPVGYATGAALRRMLPGASLEPLHAWTWTAHVATWHVMLAALPFSKLFHILSSTLSVYTSTLGPRGTPPPIDFESPGGTATLGIATPFDMTWKQLLELDACTECGRCQDACPAWAEGKPLSPKRVILDLRDHVRTHEAALLAESRVRRAAAGSPYESAATAPTAPAAGMPPLAGGVILRETLWACTTCRACEDVCPVGIEHVPLILGLRQHLVMEQGDAPEGVADMVRSLETREHPFRGATRDRLDWTAGRTPGVPPRPSQP